MTPSGRIIGVSLLALALPACMDDVGEGLGGGERLVPLAAPGPLTAFARASGTEVDLAWSDNSSDETGHRIDVNDAPFGSTRTVVDVLYAGANATSHVYPTSSGRTLYFRVLALTATLESDPSNVVTVSTPVLLSPPGGLFVSPLSPNQLGLAWSNPWGTTGSRVERTADRGTSWTAVHDGSALSSYMDSGLLPDTEYGYRVFASDAAGMSGPSEVDYEITRSARVSVATLASAGNVGQFTSIAVLAGIEQIAHYDATNTNVLHTAGTPGGSYATNTVDAGPTGAQSVGSNGLSLALDSSGAYHIAACDTTNADLRHISNLSGINTAATIASAGVTGQGPVVGLTLVGNTVQIVFVEGGTTIRRAVRPRVGPGAWAFDTVATGEWIPSGLVSFTIDSSGNPHVSYLEVRGGGSDFELRYAMKLGAFSWSNETIDAAAGGFRKSAIGVDPGGAPHVVYQKHSPVSGGDALYHASRSGTWTRAPVYQKFGRQAGAHCAVAIDPASSRIHVAWYETTDRDLRYARKDPGGAWVHRVLDVTGDVGQHPSLALSTAGVHIAYHDAAAQDLKRALGDP